MGSPSVAGAGVVDWQCWVHSWTRCSQQVPSNPNDSVIPSWFEMPNTRFSV